MDDMKIEDVILMVLAQRTARDWSGALEAFRTLFERDMAALNLYLNLTVGFLGVLFAGGIGWLILGPESTAFWIATIAIGLSILVVIWLGTSIIKQRRRKGERYLYLIRLYYYLDAVVT